MGILDQYEAADTAFKTGKVMSDDNEKLLEHLSGLSNLTNVNTGTQHRDIIRGITINHILLQRHIDSLNERNEKLTWWVITLAVAALVSTIVQTVVTVMAYVNTPTVETKSQPSSDQPQKQAIQAPASTAVQTPSSPPTVPAPKPGPKQP